MDFLCLDFINSGWEKEHKPFEELLENEEWIRQFCGKWDLPLFAAQGKTLQTLLKLRGVLCRAAYEWSNGGALSLSAVKKINEYLSALAFHLELKRENEGYRMDSIPQKRGLDWVVHRIALSFAELVTQHPADRIRLCENPGCGWIFYDDSKNHTRKWCGNTCATLIKVRRHRAAKKSRADAAPRPPSKN